MGKAATMLKVDSRRMRSTPLFWVMLGTALVMPILILVMTSMAGGTTIADPTTGAVTTMQAFTNTWQIIGSESGAGMMSMDMTAMCNINLMYFMAAVFVCLFVSKDFSSGYAKNLFTVRAKKGDYILSKTLIGWVAGTAFLLAFFLGAVLGGSLTGLSFDLVAAGVGGLVLCMLSKIGLMGVFVAISLLMSVFGRQRAWLSLILSLFGGMLLFMMIPMLTPLNAGIMNLGLCLAGGAIFAAAIGTGSRLVLNRVSLVGSKFCPARNKE